MIHNIEDLSRELTQLYEREIRDYWISYHVPQNHSSFTGSVNNDYLLKGESFSISLKKKKNPQWYRSDLPTACMADGLIHVFIFDSSQSLLVSSVCLLVFPLLF